MKSNPFRSGEYLIEVLRFELAVANQKLVGEVRRGLKKESDPRIAGESLIAKCAVDVAAKGIIIANAQINHRGFEILMPKVVLDRSNGNAVLLPS